MGKKNSKLKQETVDQLITQTYCKKNLEFINLNLKLYYDAICKVFLIHFISLPVVTEKEIKQW